MKIVIAPQAFKGSLSASEAALAMDGGVRRVLPEAQVVRVSMADGGEGTVDALVEATGGETRQATVTGPLGERVDAIWGVLGDGQTAVIEVAASSGLPLVPPERRNPMIATSYGVGELIRAALDEGLRRFIIGLGGSATNDGGAGLAQALGGDLLDRKGRPLAWGGAALADLARISVDGMDNRLRDCDIRVACDVTNPLTGRDGASAVYGPQKGATAEMVAILDRALSHYAEVVVRDLGVSVRDMPGAGAAGGLGAGLVAFLGARLEPGFDIVSRAVGLEEKLRDADLVFTGEGRLDAQSVYGKTAAGVGRLAKRHGVPVVALAGSLGEGYEALHGEGISAALSIVDGPMTLEEATSDAHRLIQAAAERALRLLAVGARLCENGLELRLDP